MGDMVYRELNNIDWPISQVTFGGASVSGEGGGYGFGQMSETEAEGLLKSAWEQGISLFDTAPIYGFGLSEERFGKYLPREAKIVSKSGVHWHENKRVDMNNSPAITEKMLKESLKRLKRDVIDIYMIHWPDSKVDIRLCLEVLQRAKEIGQVNHIGLCNTNVEDLEKAKEICEIEVIQSELNAFNRDPFDQLQNKWKDVLSMSWGTFDKGILSGRVDEKRKFDSSDCRSWAPWWNKSEVKVKIGKVQKLKEILSDYEATLTDFCLSYNLSYYGLTTTIVGFKSAEDIAQVTSSLQRLLKRETIEEILVRWK